MKFSIVTPVYNGEKYIAETIESVLSQKGDFEIEYIIADGASQDKTVEIARQYEKLVNENRYKINCKKVSFRIFSEKDNGMYDAIEKGFIHTDGDIMAYINADDKYLDGAFVTITSIFRKYPGIEWVKGINTTSDEDGHIISEGSCLLYSRKWLKKGVYGRSAYVVHQDSVFWRQTLWKRILPRIHQYRLAGDYALWITFAHEAPLWSFDKPISIFRKRPGQLSSIMAPYRFEQERISPHHSFLDKKIALFFYLRRSFGLNKKSVVSNLLFFLLFPLYRNGWYISFNEHNEPIMQKARSYIA